LLEALQGRFLMDQEDEGEVGRLSYGLDRTLALSDGVFAFALTLLVLDLFVPTLSSNASSLDLWQGLSREYVSFMNYILSFFIAGVWWNAHHRNFQHIRDTNTALRMLNILFLVWIALLPFFTKILDQYIRLQLSVVLYAVDQAAAGFLLTIIWWYASRNKGLVDKNMTQSAIRFATLRNVAAPVYFILSIGISFVSPGLTSISWYGMIPLFIVLIRLEPKNERNGKKPKKPAAQQK
jgi:uncharacterized membrane protein